MANIDKENYQETTFVTPPGLFPIPNEELKSLEKTKNQVPVKENRFVSRNKEYDAKCPVTAYSEKAPDSKKKLCFAVKMDERDDPVDQFLEHLKLLTSTGNTEIGLHFMLTATDNLKSIGSDSLAEKTNIALQVLSEGEPKSLAEARLLMQAHTLYIQGMDYLRKANEVNQLNQSEFYMKSALKLLRLHNETVEAIEKLRRGGEQRVVVQHVQVNDGGRAVVGNILSGPGGV